MMNLSSLRGNTDFAKCVKQLLVAVVIWILALLVYLLAITQQHHNSAKLEEATKVLNAVTVIKGYKSIDTTSSVSGSSFSSLSEAVNSLGLSDRIARLDSTADETVLQITKIYPDELSKLISAIDSSSMQINSAEIKTIEVNGERLLSVTISVGGVTK